MGRLAEARQEVEVIHRISPGFTGSMCEQLGHEREFERAREEALPEARRSPDLRWVFYWGPLNVFTERFQEAIAALEKTRKWSDDPVYIAYLGYCQARLGKRPEALETLVELRNLSKWVYIHPYSLALVHAGLGETDQAFAYLNQACDEHSPMLVEGGICGLLFEPCWDEMRVDPRFAKLLDRIGLPPAAKELALRKRTPSGAR